MVGVGAGDAVPARAPAAGGSPVGFWEAFANGAEHLAVALGEKRVREDELGQAPAATCPQPLKTDLEPSPCPTSCAKQGLHLSLRILQRIS